jgi:hypothetical protein
MQIKFEGSQKIKKLSPKAEVNEKSRNITLWDLATTRGSLPRMEGEKLDFVIFRLFISCLDVLNL